MQHLLPDTLKEFRYYERKLPQYLRNDDCFVEHFRLWYELCCGKGDETQGVAINEFCGVAPSSDLILHLLNIYDSNFLATLRKLDGYDGAADILDKIGAIFGLRRNFAIDYYAEPTDKELTHEEVNLNDTEFLLLIKAQIIRNYCDGSYEQMVQYYEDASLQILTINSSVYEATVDCYLNSAAGYSSNIVKLFKAGFLTIEYLGIHYTYSEAAIMSALLWADDNEWSDPNIVHTWADVDGAVESTEGVFVV